MFTEKPYAVNDIAVYCSQVVETPSETVVGTNTAFTQTSMSMSALSWERQGGR